MTPERIAKIWRAAELDFWRIAMIRPAGIVMNGTNSYYARQFLIQNKLSACIAGTQANWDGQYLLLDQMPDNEVVMVLRIYPPGKWHRIRYRIDDMDKLERLTELTPEGKIPPSQGPRLGTRISTFNELELAATRPAHTPGRHNSFQAKRTG